ncbi:MAG: transglutaminase family protein, partial [Cytophagaceae bacterium]
PSELKENSLALHAWAEVFIPGAGWIGLDPTSGMLATEGHIALACTSEPMGAAPVTGTSEIAETTLSYSNTLVKL